MIVNKPPTIIIGDTRPTCEELLVLIQDIEEAGSFLVAHNIFANTLQYLTDQKQKVVFVTRDPRDQLISAMKLICHGAWPWVPARYIEDHDERLEDLITGIHTGWRFMDNTFFYYYNTARMLPQENVYYSRFEHLVGEKGGGDNQLQLEAILTMAEFLEVSLTLSEAEDITSNIFGGTRSFDLGQIGTWKKHFSERHKALFKERYNHILIDLGYEVDDQW